MLCRSQVLRALQNPCSFQPKSVRKALRSPHHVNWCPSKRILKGRDRLSPSATRQPRVQGIQIEGAVPDDVSFEVKSDQEDTEIEYNQETKTLRFPKSVLEGTGTRRSKLVLFTCDKCGGRTARNVNPVAWEKGLVMGQCAHCEIWHVLSAKNRDIYEEIRYNDSPKATSDSVQELSSAGDAAKSQEGARKADDAGDNSRA